MYLRKSGVLFISLYTHSKSKKTRRKRTHGRHFPFPWILALWNLVSEAKNISLSLHHSRAQYSQSAKNISLLIPSFGRCQYSTLFPLNIWHSYRKKFKNQNVCIHKPVNVFEGCMGDGLNQITNNNESLIVFIFYRK